MSNSFREGGPGLPGTKEVFPPAGNPSFEPIKRRADPI
jgi:hypothetical protein